MNWFVQQRQEWIKEIVQIYGYINREHIQKKFNVSLPLAATDLGSFQKLNPGFIFYNKSSKRYELAG